MLANVDASHIILGGDFNTNFSRNRSLHTASLKTFMEYEILKCDGNIHSFRMCFESKACGSRSCLDQFLLSEHNTYLGTLCNVEFFKILIICSDLQVALSSNYTNEDERKQSVNYMYKWSKATLDHLNDYKNSLDVLQSIYVLDRYHQSHALITAAQTILLT